MEIKFSIHETPRPTGSNEKTIYHARVQHRGTKRMEDVCLHINEVSTLNSSDVKGALEAFFKYVSFQLQYGYSVELEGLGHFSVALKSKQVNDENGKGITRVTIDGVNFRCSPRLKKAVQKSTLKKVKSTSSPFPEREQRRERMMDFLASHGAINLRQYADLNSCTYYCARNDIKVFIEQGIIGSIGGATHKVYTLLEE